MKKKGDDHLKDELFSRFNKDFEDIFVHDKKRDLDYGTKSLLSTLENVEAKDEEQKTLVNDIKDGLHKRILIFENLIKKPLNAIKQYLFKKPVLKPDVHFSSKAINSLTFNEKNNVISFKTKHKYARFGHLYPNKLSLLNPSFHSMSKIKITGTTYPLGSSNDNSTKILTE